MPFKKPYKKPYEQPPPSPIEISFWETAKPLIPELEKEVWIDRKYRVDFLIPSKKIIVELYGFQYHNTKRKITKDAERERYLQRAGYRVIRFTGTEIYKDVQKCVNEVLTLGNIQPAPIATEASLIQLFEQADKRNLEKPQELEVKPASQFANKVNLPPKSVTSLPLNPKPVIRKRKFLGMENWQIATLGILAIVSTCTILLCVALILNGNVP
ncbi:MAG: DUF559 domain-containing protein [Anaerolineales bacterium]|nr:DUF559 domain-containing protein [Anaerolineales bacterium]